jgi:predicted RNase H-like nuclease (RuvC/YqgF family)
MAQGKGQSVMADYVAVIVASVSIIGNILMFILSKQERESNSEVDRATAALRTAETYDRIVISLQSRIDHLEREVAELAEENRTLRRILTKSGLSE